jgi:curved DNA-binding protein
MDYYSTLGVPKNADAKSIKHAYKKLASKHHPDKGGDEAEFKKVQSAYETLSNPQKRQEYDNPNPFSNFRQGSQPFNMNDIFGQGSPFGEIFGQRRQQRQPQYRTTIQVSLRQSYEGDSQTLELMTPAGKKVVNITIPKGVQTGQQIQYPNIVQEGTSLIIDFHVLEDSWFSRQGFNLISNHNISVLDLIVGTKFKFTTIGNKTLEVTVKPYTQPNTQIRLSGQGMPIADPRGPEQNSGRFGDQIILLKPMIPDIIESEIVNVIKKYKEIRDLNGTK